MHPILIEIGDFRIYSYGFMLALSFFLGILLAAGRAKRRGLDPNLIYDLSIILIVSAVVGSRGLYILTHRDHFRNFTDMIALWQGGATLYGGMILALAGAWVYLRRKGLSFLKVADICALSVASGEFLTRIGCFLSGCCFGKPTQCALGLVYPPGCAAGNAYPGMHIHPTQIYMSFYGLLIFLILVLLDRKKRYDGFLFGALLALYGAARFIVDGFRHYEDSARVIGNLIDNQLISIALVAAGLYLIVAGWRKSSRVKIPAGSEKNGAA